MKEIKELKTDRTSRTMIAGIIAGVLVILLIVVFTVFRVKNVEYYGFYAVDGEQLLSDAGIREGDFLFRLDYASIGSRIVRDDPYIRKITFTPVLPSTLRVTVEERNKIAYIRMPDGFVAIDDEGTALEFSADHGQEVHPLICGMDIDSVVIGHRISINNERDYQKMIIVLGAVLAADRNSSVDNGYSFFDNLMEARIVPSGLIFLTIKLPNGNTVQVKINDINSITEQMNWLVYVVSEGNLDDLPDGVLDMTGDESIFRPYE